jgi:hypothetical protein
LLQAYSGTSSWGNKTDRKVLKVKILKNNHNKLQRQAPLRARSKKKKKMEWEIKLVTLAKFPKPAISRKSWGHNGEITSNPVPRSYSTSARKPIAEGSHLSNVIKSKASKENRRHI